MSELNTQEIKNHLDDIEQDINNYFIDKDEKLLDSIKNSVHWAYQELEELNIPEVYLVESGYDGEGTIYKDNDLALACDTEGFADRIARLANLKLAYLEGIKALKELQNSYDTPYAYEDFQKALEFLEGIEEQPLIKSNADKPDEVQQLQTDKTDEVQQLKAELEHQKAVSQALARVINKLLDDQIERAIWG